MNRLENIFDDIHTLHRNRCSGELFTRLLKAKELIKQLQKPITEHRDVQRLIVQITELQAENKRLKEENEDLAKKLSEVRKANAGLGIQSVDALVERDLAQAKNKELKEALQDLYDEQNGPPLIRDKDSWQAAMNKAEQALKR